ncbi:MAG TPA: urea ABC transporter permease subunit UrtB [Bryobacteraceae bacterium]|nr:urea ABC transporter permease subunit UrtB [Bryobacteraceae bacterium]
MTPTTFLVGQLFNGLSVSSILLLMALGLAITFGLMGVINMAHGELMMLGSYTAYVLQNLFVRQFGEQNFGGYFLVALPMSFVVAGLMGLLLERALIRHLYGRPLETLLATWGVSLILQQAMRQVFGANNVDVRSPNWLTGRWQPSAGLEFPHLRLFIIVFTALAIAGMYALLFRTNIGLKIRAVTQNRDMSACLGVPTAKVDAYTFSLGSGLAGVAGCILSLMGSVGPTTGQNYIVDAFMVVVLGGVGKLAGAIAGSFGIGECNTLFESFSTATMGKVIVFTLVILFLQWKPSGLFPSKSRSLD